jgi:hypothetical protein
MDKNRVRFDLIARLLLPGSSMTKGGQAMPAVACLPEER